MPIDDQAHWLRALGEYQGIMIKPDTPRPSQVSLASAATAVPEWMRRDLARYDVETARPPVKPAAEAPVAPLPRPIVVDRTPSPAEDDTLDWLDAFADPIGAPVTVPTPGRLALPREIPSSPEPADDAPSVADTAAVADDEVTDSMPVAPDETVLMTPTVTDTTVEETVTIPPQTDAAPPESPADAAPAPNDAVAATVDADRAEPSVASDLFNIPSDPDELVAWYEQLAQRRPGPESGRTARPAPARRSDPVRDILSRIGRSGLPELMDAADDDEPAADAPADASAADAERIDRRSTEASPPRATKPSQSKPAAPDASPRPGGKPKSAARPTPPRAGDKPKPAPRTPFDALDATDGGLSLEAYLAQRAAVGKRDETPPPADTRTEPEAPRAAASTPLPATLEQMLAETMSERPNASQAAAAGEPQVAAAADLAADSVAEPAVEPNVEPIEPAYPAASEATQPAANDPAGASGEATVIMTPFEASDRAADEPSTDEPSTDEPSTDKSSADKSSADEPSADAPSTDTDPWPDVARAGAAETAADSARETMAWLDQLAVDVQRDVSASDITAANLPPIDPATPYHRDRQRARQAILRGNLDKAASIIQFLVSQASAIPHVVADLEQLVGVNDEDPILWRLLGDARYAAGDEAGAADAYREAGIEP